MSLKCWTVIDSMRSDSVDRGGTKELGFEIRRLHGGLREGVEMIDVTCGPLQFSVLPTRGMGIWKASWENVEFGWRSPVAGPVHPSFVPLYEPSGLGWLDGFDELLVRCGLLSNGAPEFDGAGRLVHPLHGRIANTPAERVEVKIDEHQQFIEICGSVLESRFHFHKFRLSTVYRCQLGQAGIFIEDTITNCSAQPAAFQLLYHLNLGPPVMDAGARIVAPVREIAPRDIFSASALDSWDTCAAPEQYSAEQVYFLRLLADEQHRSSAMLHNAACDIGMVLSFDVRQLPCFSLWKNSASLLDGYVTGLEPATNYPNVRSFEQKRGRVVTLAAKESYEIQVKLGFCCGRESVRQEVARIELLQSISPRCILEPSAEYSPLDESSSADD